MDDGTNETNRCSFSVDVSEWNEDHDVDPGIGFEDRFLDEDNKNWTCNRRVRPEDDYCLFHDHESDEGVESDFEPGQVLRDIVNGDTEDRPWNRDEPDGLWEVPVPDDDEFDRDRYKRREKQFVGASLGTVELSNERLDGPDPYPIDLRLARAEEIDLSRARVAHSLYMGGLSQTSDSRLDFHKSRFSRVLNIQDAKVRGDIDLRELEAVSVQFNGSKIYGGVSAQFLSVKDLQLRGVDIADGELSIADASTDGSVFLNDAEVAADVQLVRSDIGYDVYLDDATVDGSIVFDYTVIDGGIRTRRAEVTRRVSLEETIVDGRTSFDFSNVSVDGSIEFDGAQIDTDVDLSVERVGDSVSIVDTEVNGAVDIGAAERIDGALILRDTEVTDAISVEDGTSVGGRFAIERTTATELTVGCQLTHPAVNTVSLVDSTVDQRLRLSARTGSGQDAPVYDLARATVGDVDVDTEDSDAKLFEHLRCLETTFDGFVFSRKREEFRNTGWNIHEPRECGYRDIAVVAQRIESEEREPRPAIAVSREVVAALVTGVVTNVLDELESPDDESVDSDRSSVELATRNLDGSLFWECRQDLEAYRQGSFEPADDEQPPAVRGDPLSWALSRSSGRRQTDGTGEPHEGVDPRVSDLWELLHESFDFPRLRRAAASGEGATRRCDRYRGRLRAAVDDPTTEDGRPFVAPSEPGSPGDETDVELVSEQIGDDVDGEPLDPSMVPEPLEISDDTVTAADLERAVARTLARNPALVRELTETDVWAMAVTKLLREWGTPEALPLVQALSGAGEEILDLAEAIQDDHEQLLEDQESFGIEFGISDAPERVPDDGVHPYSAVADAILNYTAVEGAEAVLDQVKSGRVDPRRLGLDETTIERLEARIARQLVDVDRAKPTDGEVESTYAEAKNGASDAGDETAAGNFFQFEGRYARRQHWQRWKRERGGSIGLVRPVGATLSVCIGVVYLLTTFTGSSGPSVPVPVVSALPVVGAAPGPATLLGVGGLTVGLLLGRGAFGPLLKWLGNVFIWSTMGYGEQPLRVLGFSGVVVVGFAALYWAAETQLGAGPSVEDGFVGYLTFSLEMFVTLFLGGPEVTDRWVRLAAVLEGFVGVFVIGMFVVAVTRAVHR
jgi:hypothetical protein